MAAINVNAGGSTSDGARVLTSDEWGDAILSGLYPQNVFFGGRGAYGEAIGEGADTLECRARGDGALRIAALLLDWPLGQILGGIEWRVAYRDGKQLLPVKAAGEQEMRAADVHRDHGLRYVLRRLAPPCDCQLDQLAGLVAGLRVCTFGRQAYWFRMVGGRSGGQFRISLERTLSIVWVEPTTAILNHGGVGGTSRPLPEFCWPRRYCSPSAIAAPSMVSNSTTIPSPAIRFGCCNRVTKEK